MVNIADRATHLLMQLAMASGKLSFATLLSPSESAASAQRAGMGQAKDQWWLCANVPSAMFKVADSCRLRHLGKLVRGDAGTLYAVLAQQAGSWQHRFVLQLVGRQMRDYLTAATEKGFVLSLGREGHQESLVVPDCRYLQHLVNGEAVAQSCPDWKSIAREACGVATAMLNPQTVAEPCLDPARHVCVSLAVSADVAQRATQ
jgi:hypothetical protein